MLAQRLDPIDAFRRRAVSGSPVYRKRLKSRQLSIHARFVERALDIFEGSSILENIPQESSSISSGTPEEESL